MVTKYQQRPDGPLTDAFKARILAVRSANRISINKLGMMVDLSGVYLSQILRAENPKPLRSVHLPRLVRVVEDLERGRSPRPASTEPATTLEDIVRLANALGFEVSFRPLER